MSRRARKTEKHASPVSRAHTKFYIMQYNLNSTAYSELYTVYNFLLSLAITQVECERSFSKLKLIKTMLRSSLSKKNLDSLMVMNRGE